MLILSNVMEYFHHEMAPQNYLLKFNDRDQTKIFYGLKDDSL